MSDQPNPITWAWRRHVPLLLVSMTIMMLSPYLGSLPVRTIPTVVALTAGEPAPSGELELFLGSHASDLTAVLALLILAGAISFGLAILNTRVAATLSSRANRDLRLELHKRLLARPPAYLREPGKADMLRTAILNQTRTVAMYAMNTLPATLGIFFAVVIWGQTLYSAVSAPGTGATAALVVIVVVGVLLVVNLLAVWISGKKSQQGQRAVMKEQGAFIGLAGESISSLRSLQLNVAQDEHHQRVSDTLDRMSKAEIRVAAWGGLSSAAGAGAIMLGIPLLVVGWQALGLQGEKLAVMIPALLMLQRAISSVGSLWTTRKVSRPAIDLVSSMMVDDPSIYATGDAKLADVSGAIKFDDVHWAVDGNEILRGASFDVKPGEIVALVGKGGSGKSSLLRLALRMQAADKGSITLDGIDVWTLAIDDLRSRVGILEQHPAFFDRTLRENIVLDGREVSDERIMEIARLCHIAELVEKIGLDNPLPKGGETLSGSEKRRLALTRLLLRDPDVLFVDELEAGLHQSLAQDLLRNFREHTQGKTCLMVTHRPDLLAADRIAFVHEGRILDMGTHAELSERCAPYRETLAQQQEDESE